MRKLLSLFCALMLLCASLPAWADGEFSAYVKKGAATIYSDAKLKTPAGSLRKNTVVTVLAYRDGVAKIQYKSRTGFARVSNLGRVSDMPAGRRSFAKARFIPRPPQNRAMSA